MFERDISVDDVREVIMQGQTIEAYPDARPYPSRLVLGWRGTRPLHIVVAENSAAGETVIITSTSPTQLAGRTASRGGERRELCHLQAG